jgi:hypothetical protein
MTGSENPPGAHAAKGPNGPDAAYFGLLGLDPAIPDDQDRRKAALLRAHGLRTFEIEHYWKRATYFWAFQVAIFAAFGLLNKPGSDGWGPIPLLIAALGVLTAVANWLSAQGSKFWQENWEAHIDVLEDEFEGRLHKTVAGVSRYSVSRLNQELGVCFIAFWAVMLAYAAYQTLPPLIPLRPIPSETAATIWVGVVLAAVVLGVCRLASRKSTMRRRVIEWRLRD